MPCGPYPLLLLHPRGHSWIAGILALNASGSRAGSGSAEGPSLQAHSSPPALGSCSYFPGLPAAVEGPWAAMLQHWHCNAVIFTSSAPLLPLPTQELGHCRPMGGRVTLAPGNSRPFVLRPISLSKWL